mgnify:CR=1 FL=1
MLPARLSVVIPALNEAAGISAVLQALAPLAARGAQLKNALQQAFADLPAVQEVRGEGLMIGVVLDRPCGALVRTALEEARLLINVTAERVIRLLPPLVISEAETEEIAARLVPLVRRFVRGGE